MEIYALRIIANYILLYIHFHAQFARIMYPINIYIPNLNQWVAEDNKSKNIASTFNQRSLLLLLFNPKFMQ